MSKELKAETIRWRRLVEYLAPGHPVLKVKFDSSEREIEAYQQAIVEVNQEA